MGTGEIELYTYLLPLLCHLLGRVFRYGGPALRVPKFDRDRGSEKGETRDPAARRLFLRGTAYHSTKRHCNL